MKGTLYRSREGIIFGVCRGFADYFDLSAFWIRIAMIIIFFATGFFPIVLVYVLLGLILKLEPVIKPSSPDEEEFYQSYAGASKLGLGRLKDKFESLDKRIQRMESYVTDRAYDWERRFRAGS